MQITRSVKPFIIGFLIVAFFSASTHAAPRLPQPPWPQATLKVYSFDSEFWKVPWNNVAVNEEFSPLAESWSGYALVREGLVVPVAIPVVQNKNDFNVSPNRGSIRFWFAPNWSSADAAQLGDGPGHLARLVELVDYSGKSPRAVWSLYFNESGDRVYLTASGDKGGSDVLSATVSMVAGDWRMFTLCYSETNTVLSVDAKEVASGGGLPTLALEDCAGAALVIGSDAVGGVGGAAEGQFEEFTTMRHWPRKSDWQELYFDSMKARSLLGPVGNKAEETVKLAVYKSAQGGAEEESGGMMLMRGGSGGGPMYSYAAGSFWLEIVSATNGVANLILHGTVEDVAYELLSKTWLSNSVWAGEQVLIGAAGQDWTAAAVTIGERTNNLFFWARSLVDTDGDGLPDWWETQFGFNPNDADTGGTGVSDGYRDGDNDGWTNIEEYQNGTLPNAFNMPPAPKNLRVAMASGGAQANLSWRASGGLVTGYNIERHMWWLDLNAGMWFYTNASSVGSSATSFSDNSPELNSSPYIPYYRIQATYAAGNSAWSDLVKDELKVSPDIGITAGSNGLIQVLAQEIPSTASALRFLLDEANYVDIPIAAFTNGVADVPEPFSATLRDEPLHDIITSSHLRWVSSNGITSDYWSPEHRFYPHSFLDCRRQLKENLIYQLRAASPNESFSYRIWYPNFTESFFITPSDYAYAGFYRLEDYQDYPWLTYYMPIWDNLRFRNFVFATTNFDQYGWLKTGVRWNSSLYLYDLTNAPQYGLYQTTNFNANISHLSAAESRWTHANEKTTGFNGVDLDGWPWDDFGLWGDLDGNVFMSSGYRNWYGLEYLSFRLAWSNNVSSQALLTPSTPLLWPVPSGYLYPETAQPIFQTVGYYFARWNSGWIQDRDRLPMYSDPDFATNQSPLLIVPCGISQQLAAYAKLAILNGYTNKFGYLAQYFDKAFKIASNGAVTTNQTGILSEYGRFFPTEPGPTALVTMPDLDTGERGTGTVHVIKLQLDVNHDGVMDLSYTGPDNTSPSKPFTFWVNNDKDYSGNSADLGHDVLLPPTNGISPLADCTGQGIQSRRDLEDLARLWICGIPALATNAGYQVMLSWNVSSGSPAINLFNAAETNGGIAYMTNLTTANAQISGNDNYVLQGPGWKIGTVSPSQSLTFTTGYFTNGNNKYFLFEGAGIGKGELVLTISQNGTNVLAQTSAWFDFKHIKDMFEHAHIEGVITTFPSMRTNSTSVSTFKLDNQPDTGMGDAKQLIVQLHGWNNSPDQSENYAQTMFKRLYWAGYQGRYAALRWPTLSEQTNPYLGTAYLTYNRSEYIAFRSAAGASAYFNNLRTRYPDYSINAAAHSMGNIVMMEALKLQAASGSNALNNYALMEAAVPAHCYDTNAALCPGLFTSETPPQTPNTYLGYPGAVTNALRAGGKMINFFNTNDFALGWWVGNQQLKKPDGGLGYYMVPPLQPYLSWNTPVTDPREIMSFVARPRSYAIGAQPGVHDMITGIEVDLAVQFGFGEQSSDHSGQYTRSIQQVRDFYITLLQRFQQ